MNRLARTRSQHFVSSPRRMASPLKSKLSITGLRHAPKRRRLGSSGLSVSQAIQIDSDDDEDSGAASPVESRARRVAHPLSSEVGQQMINRSRSRRSDAANLRAEGGRAKDVFGSSDGSSPRKRKRSDRGLGLDSDGDSSWVEVDEDEEEPEFIAESDQHLLADAPAYALHRLRKAELIRLWKVAGMWDTPEDEGDSIISTEDEDDKGMAKKELVDGLIDARKPSSARLISPLPSPRRLDSAIDLNRATLSPSPSSGGRLTPRNDTDATPRAVPRTRSKTRNRLIDGTPMRSAPRRIVNGKNRNGMFRMRSKSMGGDRDGRKARFGDDVKSPAAALAKYALNFFGPSFSANVQRRRTRRSSTTSSAYTTTDTSPPANPISRQTPRRTRRPAEPRGFTPARRLQQTTKVTFDSKTSSADDERDDGEETGRSTDDEAMEPTPLIRRLRPRRDRLSFVNDPSAELEADGEEEDEEAEIESPGPSRIRRRNSKPSSDLSLRLESRSLPNRGAKAKAIEALHDGMDVDEQPDVATEVDDDESPRSGPLTRSQLRHMATTPPTSQTKRSRRASRASLMNIDVPDSASTLTTLPSVDSASEEEATLRTTRSGKSFGVMQTRKSRLRQEAIDDPDMEVDEEEDDEDDDEDESFEAGESFIICHADRADYDLSSATVGSLTRLLRDELVQLCEARGIEVGGTKPQLAKALLDWRDEQQAETKSTSSTSTAKPPSVPPKLVHAVASHKHVPGKTTPVLLRDHIHATDPATPPPSDESRHIGEAELNFDLAELGLEDSIIKPGQLQKLERIGSGGFKDVYVGKYKGRKVAVSEFREHLSEMDIRELKLLAEFSHPNIVKFRGICIPEDASQVPCMLVSELCENGDLFDYIRNVPCPSLKRVLGLMLDIARGLEYLHTRRPAIIHRDCKSSNILITRAGVAKVGDFGLARVKRSTRSMIRSLVGTVNWQAPELWHPAPRYDYKVDVFSAAMVYWEMLSGWGTGDKKYPWEGHNEHYIYDAVGTKQRRPSVAGLRKQWGDEPVNLLERMWHQDPGERPTMSDVVADLESLIAECN